MPVERPDVVADFVHQLVARTAFALANWLYDLRSFHGGTQAVKLDDWKIPDPYEIGVTRVVGREIASQFVQQSDESTLTELLDEAATRRKTTWRPQELFCTHISLYRGDDFAIFREDRPA